MSSSAMSELRQRVDAARETLHYYRWWIFFGTLILTLASMVVITVLPDEYQASTTILVEPAKVPPQYVPDSVGIGWTDQLATISEQVLSSTNLEQLIDQFNLYPNEQKSIGREALIHAMRAHIDIAVKNAAGNGPGAFTISYSGRNPSVVAQVANQLASGFIDKNLKMRQQLAVGTTQFLEQQLTAVRSNLEDREAKIRAFKMKYLGQMPEQLPANLEAISQLQTTLVANADQLNHLQQQQLQIQNQPLSAFSPSTALLASGKPATERDALEAQRAGLQSRMALLEQEYTPEYPDVLNLKMRIAGLTTRINALPPDPVPKVENGHGKRLLTARQVKAARLTDLSRQMAALEQQQAAIKNRIAEYQSKADAAPLRQEQFTDLSRGYSTTKDRYDSLLQKEYSAQMAADLEAEQKAARFSVLDPAVPPQSPYAPKRPLLMAGAAFAAFALCVGLALGLDQLNPAVKAESDLMDTLPKGSLVLASIPVIETVWDRRKHSLFRIVALSASLAACLMVAGFIWMKHPSMPL